MKNELNLDEKNTLGASNITVFSYFHYFKDASGKP